jgi:hypothetical protein
LIALAIVGLSVPRLRLFTPPASAVTNVWLMPRTARTTRKLAEHVAVAASAPLAAAAKPKTAPPEPPVAPAAPKPAAPGPPTSEPGPPTPAPPGAGFGQGVQGALRAGIGCDVAQTAHLTPEEKDRCNQRFGREAHRGPAFIDPIPEEKRAYYDAIQQAYQAAHDPMHNLVRDRYGNIVTWGHPPGGGCGMSWGGPKQPPDHRSLTDKIKATGAILVDIGPLKCGIVIPQGSMTPEIGIPTP